jgi:uncharacterized membrane protein YhiD involved in acid resistance
MIEPLVIAITNLIFPKALEKIGENLGDAVSSKISQLAKLIQEKFAKESVEGKFTKAQEDPSEKNQERFKQELTMLMEDDDEFANKLKVLVSELKADPQVEQIFFKNVAVTGDAEIGNIEQSNTGSGSVKQEAFTESEVRGSLKIGNVKQQN